MGDEDRTLRQCSLEPPQVLRIEAKLDAVLEEVRQIQSYDGPIGQLMQKISVQEQTISTAHTRIDEHDVHIEKIRGTLWSIVWKIAAIGFGGGGTAYAAVEIIQKISGG